MLRSPDLSVAEPDRCCEIQSGLQGRPKSQDAEPTTLHRQKALWLPGVSLPNSFGLFLGRSFVRLTRPLGLPESRSGVCVGPAVLAAVVRVWAAALPSCLWGQMTANGGAPCAS